VPGDAQKAHEHHPQAPWKRQADLRRRLHRQGENPKGVVEYIRALKDCSPNVDCFIGNHEALFLDYLNGRNEAAYIRNGGWNTLRSYELEERGEGESFLSRISPCSRNDRFNKYDFLRLCRY